MGHELEIGLFERNIIGLHAKARINAHQREHWKWQTPIEAIRVCKAFNWNIAEEADRFATRAKLLGQVREASEISHNLKTRLSATLSSKRS